MFIVLYRVIHFNLLHLKTPLIGANRSESYVLPHELMRCGLRKFWTIRKNSIINTGKVGKNPDNVEKLQKDRKTAEKIVEYIENLWITMERSRRLGGKFWRTLKNSRKQG